MEEAAFSSPPIAEEIKRVYGDSAKVIKINMRHEEEVRKYVMNIEEARKKAATSRLHFP